MTGETVVVVAGATVVAGVTAEVVVVGATKVAAYPTFSFSLSALDLIATLVELVPALT